MNFVEKKKSGKKVIAILAVIAVLVLTIGGAYALWMYSNTLGNQTLISGDIYMKYTEGNSVNIKEAMPSATYNPDEYFEFTVEGKNKYSKDVIYEILLDEGEVPTGEGNESRTERIKPELLKFRLVEVTADEEGNEQEEELIQEASYDSIKMKRIWVDKVPAKTEKEIKYKYRLYMWISKDTKIGDAETDDYTAEVWNNNVFASVKVAVNGDFNPKDLTEDYLILNAQDTSGEKYDLKQPTGATKDIIVTLGSKREITKFVVSKSEQYPIALMSLPDKTDYEASYNETTRAWEAKVTIEETGIYDYYAVYDEKGTKSKTYSFTVLMSPDRYVKVEKPTSALCKAGLTYTGSPQDLIDESNLDQTGYTITQKQGTDADKYQVTAKLKKEYAWSDSSRNDATFECEIAKKDTVLTYEPVSEFKVNKGTNKTLVISATTEGEFTVTSEAEGTVTATPKTSNGSSATITVNGVEIGSTKLDIKFVPTNKNYTEKEETYDVEVAKAAGAAKLKENLGTGGLVGIPTNCNETSCTPITDKNADASTIREYRYTGATANNYVTFNDEKWRILGIFKDESGNEHIKIVRNEVLKRDAFPATYTANGTTYKIQYTSSGDYAYWNRKSDDSYDNNWVKGGLMNWLNSNGAEGGYFNSLSGTAQGMIEEEATWYLGNVYWDDTTIQSYENERKSTKCSVTSNSHNSNCYVWPNNEATWTGKIGLMYQSDYGFTIDSSYWTNKKLNADYSTFRDSSWLYKDANHTVGEWFLSPSSSGSGNVACWGSDGYVGNDYAYDNLGVRPVLYLKSDVTINGTGGTSSTPYTLTN